MKIDEAERLRRAWKEKREKGGPPCDHPVVDKERAERGQGTGDFVCTTSRWGPSLLENRKSRTPRYTLEIRLYEHTSPLYRLGTCFLSRIEMLSSFIS